MIRILLLVALPILLASCLPGQDSPDAPDSPGSPKHLHPGGIAALRVLIKPGSVESTLVTDKSRIEAFVGGALAPVFSEIQVKEGKVSAALDSSLWRKYASPGFSEWAECGPLAGDSLACVPPSLSADGRRDTLNLHHSGDAYVLYYFDEKFWTNDGGAGEYFGYRDNAAFREAVRSDANLDSLEYYRIGFEYR